MLTAALLVRDSESGRAGCKARCFSAQLEPSFHSSPALKRGSSGPRYRARVIAHNSGGPGRVREVVLGTPKLEEPAPPGAPHSLRVLERSAEACELTWTCSGDVVSCIVTHARIN